MTTRELLEVVRNHEKRVGASYDDLRSAWSEHYADVDEELIALKDSYCVAISNRQRAADALDLANDKAEALELRVKELSEEMTRLRCGSMYDFAEDVKLQAKRGQGRNGE